MKFISKQFILTVLICAIQISKAQFNKSAIPPIADKKKQEHIIHGDTVVDNYITDDNILLLNTDMNVGHGGATGRFTYFEAMSLMHAFIFELEGIKK